MMLETPDRAAVDQAPQPWLARYREVRKVTEVLCSPLSAEDCVVQSMPDASPAKWHLAHTSWFFETFVLMPAVPGYKLFNERFAFLFNSYYNAVGERVARPKRGLLSRPALEDVYVYRRHVDKHMAVLLREQHANARRLEDIILLGLNHEQQHQELILTDIKHLFGTSPVRPAYREDTMAANTNRHIPLTWKDYGAGLQWIGHDGNGFAYDNESPRHRAFVAEFQLGWRLVNNGEFLAFMDDGGYERPELWLSDGWNARCTCGWQSPMYWEKQAGGWQIFTLTGLRPLDRAEPVCHVSFYEADAYARWAAARLPTEAEWEVAAGSLITGNLLDSDRLHPLPPGSAEETQMFGDVWEWTASPYTPYPGYRPSAGALGEYNGKFMCNQMVLRGGSCATPRAHIRPTYRNFFPPEARWQFSGIRLARDGAT
jgi:ergothioneine biosynthesis protein EgtB